MADRIVLRVGSWTAIIGGLLALVVNVVSPRPDSSKIGDPRAFLDTASNTTGWELIQLGVIVALLLLLVAFHAITKTIEGGHASYWAHLGLGAVTVGTALGLVTFAIGTQWSVAVGALGIDSVVASYSVTSGVFLIWSFVYFGVAAALYGYAFKLSNTYPDWLGWLAMLAGLAGLVFGIIESLSGVSTFTTFVLFPIASGLTTLIVIYVGYLMGRRAMAA